MDSKQSALKILFLRSNSSLSGKSSGPKLSPKNFVPGGLYPKATWDLKVLKKEILARRLAPIFPGQISLLNAGAEADEDIEADDTLEECPICFLFYPQGLNRTICCSKGLCTECYLQVKIPHKTDVSCPFCNRANFRAVYRGPRSSEEMARIREEEQAVVQAQLRAQKEEDERSEQARLERLAQRAASVPPEPAPQVVPKIPVKLPEPGRPSTPVAESSRKSERPLGRSASSSASSSEKTDDSMAMLRQAVALSLTQENIVKSDTSSSSTKEEEEELNSEEEFQKQMALAMELSIKEQGPPLFADLKPRHSSSSFSSSQNSVEIL